MLIARWLGVATALRDIPSNRTRVLWVGVIGTSLTIDTHTPEGNDDDVDNGTDDRDPHMHDK